MYAIDYNGNDSLDMEDRIMNGCRGYAKMIAVAGLAFLVCMTVVPAHASGGTDALLLSCMDYRLVDHTHSYMDERGIKGRYDHVVLAGASLGATTDTYPAWRNTFWEHLDVAIQLHNIHRVILLDHRDCGAYKVIYDKNFSADAEAEAEIHAKHLRELKEQIGEKYPDLHVETLLIDLDGVVAEIE